MLVGSQFYGDKKVFDKETTLELEDTKIAL
jgi:hypothetical protein